MGSARVNLHSHVSVSSMMLGEKPLWLFIVVSAYCSSISDAAFMSSMLASIRLMFIGLVGRALFRLFPCCGWSLFLFILMHLWGCGDQVGVVLLLCMYVALVAGCIELSSVSCVFPVKKFV